MEYLHNAKEVFFQSPLWIQLLIAVGSIIALNYFYKAAKTTYKVGKGVYTAGSNIVSFVAWPVRKLVPVKVPFPPKIENLAELEQFHRALSTCTNQERSSVDTKLLMRFHTLVREARKNENITTEEAMAAINGKADPYIKSYLDLVIRQTKTPS